MKNRRITVTMDREILDWLDEKVKAKIFANRSHGLEVLAKKGSKNEEE